MLCVFLLKFFMYKNCVYCIFIMTTKCLSHPDTILKCVMNWPSNITGEIIHRSLNNAMSSVLLVKWEPKIKVWPFILLFNLGETSHKKGKWFAIGRLLFPWLGWYQNHSSDFTFNENNRDHFHTETHSKISKFVIYNYACSTYCRFACTKASRHDV